MIFLSPGGPRMWPRPGYWTPNETVLIVQKCLPPATERCLGGRLSGCGQGYTQAQCAYCEPDYYWDTGNVYILQQHQHVC